MLSDLRHAIRAHTHTDEPQAVDALLSSATLDQAARAEIHERAVSLVERCRQSSHKAGTLDAFLQEFGLSNKEGIALMCLAEALLRVPDEETADRLIAEKIRTGDWGAHKGRSTSRFVNASVWGLMLTGRVVALDEDVTRDTTHWMQKLVSSLGEPVVRKAVLQAMRIMGGQYVLGRTIDEALRKGAADNPSGTRFSFDMLGEGARTEADAKRYFDAYAEAIRVISAANRASNVHEAHGISVKLSALHPRYEFRQPERVMAELLPRIRELALMARDGGLGLSIDAEECDRLDLSLDIFDKLARDPALADWQGLGFVLQAYQKRAVWVCDWLIALAQDAHRQIMVRLVKGAYWDSEIKHAQEQGFADYPVFSRKCHSDLSYQVCAQKLLADSQAIYPQFATHNAYTVAVIESLTTGRRDFEYQRLHGMGHLLYEQLISEKPETALRVYAPVGNHKDLLPYLVRRLLENGANSSFVNRFLDKRVAPEQLLSDPIVDAQSSPTRRHPQIPVPRDLFREETFPWLNARGVDLENADVFSALRTQLEEAVAQAPIAAPIVGGVVMTGSPKPVRNPATGEVIGQCIPASKEVRERAVELASAAQASWDLRGGAQRAELLELAAQLLEDEMNPLVGLIVAEAGRTIEDAISEVREAVDFCRYYAQQGRRYFAEPQNLPGPTGEQNELSLHGRGVFLCISPWNFPLAIFVGQVAAALVSGNTVLAKPAEQTPLVAARAIALLHRAGVPGDVLHLLPGGGEEVAAPLVDDPRVNGVVFTGGTDTAQRINRQLAQREGPITPLIAETGGLNVMLVDATALPEQVVDDVIASAFQSAGQRCSALRVLYLQEDIADNVLTMLKGAVAELRVGNPLELQSDLGPLIDLEARQQLERHAERMQREGTLIAEVAAEAIPTRGYFFAPRVYEIRSLSQLEGEAFGPILHVIRYRVADLTQVLEEIRGSGYGLTLGVHSRIDGFAREVFERTRVGNTYINRNMVGAVVGVNPFGGQGLSGTGPKAGGPHYLLRFATEKTRTDNIVAKGGNAQLFTLQD
ncbi:MAG: bifunctional proline dehydrogenase/L-glutamate gamma-semialdehyde dehydrogenase PutA [Congregibacter sp.]